MKYLVQGILMLIWVASILLMFLYMIDLSVAQRDYQRLKDNGDYEKRVEGCIFDRVCEHYTKELWK